MKGLVRRALVADTRLDRLYWQSALLVVALYALCKALARTLQVRPWGEFDGVDIVVLLLLVLAVGAFSHFVNVGVERTRDEEERRRREADALAAENAAIVRVAQVVTEEFAQPLSGALGYSELLMMRAGHLTDGARRELEGVREGVLQLERLLQTLRHSVEKAACCDGRRIADDVARDIAAPRPRLAVRAAGSGRAGAARKS